MVRVSSRIPEGQVGALFASRGKIQGLELFDSSKTFSHYLERLVSSYALSSLADRSDGKDGVTPDTNTFMESIKNASAERFDALGEGADLRLSGEALAGGALLAEERIVHLVAFDIQSTDRPSRSRRFHSHPVH